MIRISANGVDISPAIDGRVLSCTITDRRADRLDELVITLDNHDSALTVPDPGATLQVWLQDHSAWVYMGIFEVDMIALSYPPAVLSIRATSGDITSSIKANRDDSYHATSLGDVLAIIANRNDLQLSISPELASETIDHLDQTAESDLSLISRLGEHYDAAATVKNDHIIFVKTGAGSTPVGTELPTLTLQLSNCTSLQCERLKTPYTGVSAGYNNRAYARRDVVIVGSDNNPFVIRSTYRTEKLARTAAESKWARLQRAENTLSLELDQLHLTAMADAWLEITDAPEGIKKTGWLINEVEHRMSGDGNKSGDGFITRVNAELIN